MTSNLQILSDLRLAMEMKQTLEIMVFYKGVPVICKAQISAITGEITTAITQASGIVSIKKAAKVSILGSDYFEPSSAHVEDVDYQSGQLQLRDFSYLGNRLGERMIVRVEPKTPIPLVLTSMDQQIEAELVDLSINGAGIRLQTGQYYPSLKPGALVRASFDLPGQAIELDATVISGTKVADRFRISIGFTGNGVQKAAIFRYLVDRRSEIEQEILAEYHEVIRKTEN